MAKQAHTDHRVERSKERVLAATYELLVESGLGGVSVDAIVARSQVAKTTIYRHWPDRAALLLEACANLESKPVVPDTGSLKGDLTVLALHVARQVRSKRSTVVPSIMDAAERDPDIEKLFLKMQSEIDGTFRTVIERSRRRKEISKGIDASEIVLAILAPIAYRRWFSRERIDDRFVKRLVERALR